VLEIAAASAKERFPRCGGFLTWMGHDSFPCTANTSIVDFEGNLKPAARAVEKIYRGDRQ
jgi:beta-mannosidase